jgi:hypothetical protein
MRIPLFLVAAAVMFFGCDSGDDSNPPSSISISGRVTEDASYGKTADVEGAVVSAASVESDGQLSHHPDTTVVQANGRYTLEIEEADDVNQYVLVEAVGDTFSTSVILLREPSDDSAVAAPMNGESDAEADVFVASRSDAAELTLPRISAFVDAAVAAELQDGSASASEVAMLILEGQEAEEEYVEQREPDSKSPREPVDDKRDTDEAAYLDLQTALDASTTATAEQEAIADFEDVFVTGYVNGGVSTSLNAEAAEVGRSAMVEFAADASVSADVAAAARNRADLFVGLALSAAVRAQLVAADASATALAAVDAAASAMLSAIANATSSTQVDAAFDAYGVTVDAQLAATIGVSEAVLLSARVATDAARATLDAAIDVAADAEAIAVAHKAYFAAAEAAAEAALATSADAEIGAEVVALTSLR